MKPILVFKTSVKSSREAAILKPILDSLLPLDERWNFDLDDEENILRIESLCRPGVIIEALNAAGHMCEELPD